MAQQEDLVGGGFGGQLQVFLRFDDQTLEGNRLRWVNGTGRTLEAAFTKGDGSSTKVQIPASASGQRALPAGTVQGIWRTPEGEEPYYVWDAAFSFVTTSAAQAAKE